MTKYDYLKETLCCQTLIRVSKRTLDLETLLLPYWLDIDSSLAKVKLDQVRLAIAQYDEAYR